MAEDQNMNQSDEELKQQIKQDKEEKKRRRRMLSNNEEDKVRIDERILKNRLKLIKSKLSISGRTFLKPSEKKAVTKAKKHKNLNSSVMDIDRILMINGIKAFSKGTASLPSLYYIFLIGLIILIVIVVFAALASIMPWLFGDDDSGEASAKFGITGNDFYGARMVYKDDEKAVQTIIADYSQFVGNGIAQAQLVENVSVGGTNYSVELNFDGFLPTEENYYLTFDESDYQTNYPALYNIVLNDIAKPIYKVDNGEDYLGTTLVDCANGIKYFGFAKIDEIAPVVAENLIQPSNITATKDGGGEVEAGVLGEIEDMIETQVANYFNSLTKYSTRTEKLFVKDYILTEDDEMISGVKKENYVAFIFMPKRNVMFSQISFIVGNADISNLSITLDGDELPTEGSNLGNEEKQAFIYGGTVAINAEKFSHIDENNLTVLDNISLFDIVENVDNFSLYLEEKTTEGENPTTYFTIWQDGVVVKTENSEPFSMVEYETVWF